VREGRNLVLTESGHAAARYADQIFALGEELVDSFHRKTTGPRRLVVGISDVLARSIVHRILEPAFEHGMRVVCKESRSSEAFDLELVARTMDVVLSNSPASRSGPVRMYSHVLGECGTTWFAAPPLARRLRRSFPQSLHAAPLLLPAADSSFRRELDAWFAHTKIKPTIVAELDDAALVSILGEKQLGVFAAPDVIEKEVRQRYRVEVVGRSARIRQRFYAISLEREIKHPGVVAICENAREDLFEG
jgi:LysR family transcriptional regulator, transcriptional activator of nhaA